MANERENPCRNGLTPECFASFPKWAKQAFFYRLLHLLLPAQITSKLPTIFKQGLLFPGAQFPLQWTPGDPIPEGATIPPGAIFPPGWQFGDPWPSGVLIWNEFTAPEWFVLPDGTVVLPGALIPPGWQPGDPLPDGFLSELGIPETSLDTGVIPPLHDIVFIGGSGSWGIGATGAVSAYSFSDTFATIDLTEWTVNISVEGTIDIVAGQLRMQKAMDAGLIYYLRSDSAAELTNYYFSFMLNFISGASRFQFTFFDGSYYVQVRFLLTSTLEIYSGTTWQSVTLSDFTGVEHDYKFSINNGKMTVRQDNIIKAIDLNLEVFVTPAGTHRFILNDTGNVRVDNFRLTGI
jgi:hypothetical protein